MCPKIDVIGNLEIFENFFELNRPLEQYLRGKTVFPIHTIRRGLLFTVMTVRESNIIT
jgi:hypothetical protein